MRIDHHISYEIFQIFIKYINTDFVPSTPNFKLQTPPRYNHDVEQIVGHIRKSDPAPQGVIAWSKTHQKFPSLFHTKLDLLRLLLGCGISHLEAIQQVFESLHRPYILLISLRTSILGAWQLLWIIGSNTGSWRFLEGPLLKWCFDVSFLVVNQGVQRRQDLSYRTTKPFWIHIIISYCWWKHQLMSSLPHYPQGPIHPRWLFGISSITSYGDSCSWTDIGWMIYPYATSHRQVWITKCPIIDWREKKTNTKVFKKD